MGERGFPGMGKRVGGSKARRVSNRMKSSACSQQTQDFFSSLHDWKEAFQAPGRDSESSR